MWNGRNIPKLARFESVSPSSTLFGILQFGASRNQMVLMGFTVLCYPAILAIVIGRKRNGTSGGASVSYTRHMFKSLVAIVLVLLVGQSMSSITRMLGLQVSWRIIFFFQNDCNFSQRMPLLVLAFCSLMAKSVSNIWSMVAMRHSSMPSGNFSTI
jgi:glycerol-3-phosphate acyltransferase PlsY